MKEGFFVTTPIYYVNAEPHIGTIYTTIAADVLARYRRKQGLPVLFLTGTDEHGQKIEQAAAERGIEPLALADGIVEVYETLWRRLDISNDEFIRTTEERHAEAVRKFIGDLYEKGDIYLGKYEGWYCVHEESFWLESQLVEGNCPDCGRPVTLLEEENYFFRLSAYADRLIGHIEANPAFIQPESRRNEILSFIKGGLNDQSITRKTFTWGIPVPFDPEHVVYVWFEALINYLSGIGYAGDEALFGRFWPADAHLVGKDILRFHAVMWPAMLMAAGLELPRTIFAHGWILVDDEKMSKSRGNIVSPGYLLDKYGTDRVRYFLMREFTFGLDGNYSEESMLSRVNGDLANDLGNLVSRSLAMLEKYRGGSVPAPGTGLADDFQAAFSAYARCLDEFRFSEALATVWERVRATNRLIDSAAPWDLAKEPEKSGELDAVLYDLAESLRLIAHMLQPFIPSSAVAMLRKLGIPHETEAGFREAFHWGGIVPGTIVNKGEALFARLLTEED